MTDNDAPLDTHKLTDADKELARRLESACFGHLSGRPVYGWRMKSGLLRCERTLDELLEFSGLKGTNIAAYASTDCGEVFGIVYVAEDDVDEAAMLAIAPPSATLASSTGIKNLLYILDGSAAQIAQTAAAMGARNDLYHLSNHFMTPLGDARLIGEAKERLERDEPLRRYDAQDLLLQINGFEFQSVLEDAPKRLLAAMPHATYSLCDSQGESIQQFDRLDEAVSFLKASSQQVHLNVRAAPSTELRGIVVKVNHGHDLDPLAHRKGPTFTIRSAQHSYYVYLAKLTADDKEVLDAYAKVYGTGPMEILTQVPLPYGEFTIDPSELKVLSRHGMEYDCDISDIAWAVCVPVDLADRFHRSCLKHVGGEPVLHFWSEISQKDRVWEDSLQDAYELITYYPRRIQILSTRTASSNGKSFGICYHSASAYDLQAMLKVAEPSYTIEYDEQLKDLVYLLSGPEKEIAQIRNIIDDNKSLGLTLDRIATPLAETQLSRDSKLNLLAGVEPKLYQTGDFLLRLQGLATSRVTDNAAPILLDLLDVPEFVLCDHMGENAIRCTSIVEAMKNIAAGLSHMRFSDQSADAPKLVVVESDAQLPYPSIAGIGTEPSFVLRSQTTRYSVYISEIRDAVFDVRFLQDRCTADWVSIRDYFPLPCGDVSITPEELKRIWLDRRVSTHPWHEVQETIAEVIDRLHGRVYEGID